MINNTIIKSLCLLWIAFSFFTVSANAQDLVGKNNEITKQLMLGDKHNSSAHEEIGGLLVATDAVERLAKALTLGGGTALIFFGIKKYNNYRMDPGRFSLQPAILLFIIGLLLVVMSFIPMYF